MTRLSAVVLGLLMTPILAVFLWLGVVVYIARDAFRVGYRDGERLVRWIRSEWQR